jgi:hypothetical protein
MKMQKFKDYDWDAFAGAEINEDGREPIIGGMGIKMGDGKEYGATIIVDGSGISVLWYVEDENGLEAKDYSYTLELKYDIAQIIASRIERKTFPVEYLDKLGFTKLS